MEGNSSGTESQNVPAKVPAQRLGWISSIAHRTPLPYRHLNTMFGLSAVVAIVSLVGGGQSFYRSADIDRVPAQVVKYCVDMNTDRWVEFANLPFIGEKTAKAIVAYGEKIGGYRSVEQLREVKGVGEKTLVSIRAFVITSGPIDAVKPTE